ncbi:dienelactone hydrolase family protein [Georgenia daeguensis]|uniref:dienelactone hydrolase family protein n=1 Tax=Georgenia daeguensis TaxID=908355 RepID=UPI0031F0CD52
MDEVREWWVDRLGVDGRRDVPWRPGPERAAGKPLDPRWTEQEVTLGAPGDELTCVIVRPSEADGAVARPALGPAPARRPAVVVPFYDVESVLGRPSPRPTTPGALHAFAAPLVEAGLVVMVVPWWFETVAGTDAPADLDGRYGPAAARHAATRADTPLGRSVSDVIAAVDHLRTLDDVDPGRIGLLGHSLGGKLTLVTAALDPRVAAAAAHEPGVGFAHSNWAAPWYLGEHVPKDRDLDELLGLVAPRPFLLVGGGSSDGAHNRDLLAQAAARWGEGGGLDVLTHDGGHPVPPHVLAACVAWLAGHLAGPGADTGGTPRPEQLVSTLPGAGTTAGGRAWHA